MIELYHGDCLDIMPIKVPDKSVDLTVTSPPYDNLRTYNNSLEWGEHIWKPIIQELYRITKDGGVVVWVVGDATIKGSETGTSFRQALYFKEIGFNLADTMIWEKANPFNFGSNNLYPQSFEYMFIFTKGHIKTHNLIRDRVIKNKGKKFKQTRRGKDDYMEYDNKEIILENEFGKRYNIWKFSTNSIKEHPAIFPEQLANDHIISWSNEGDLVYDPFMGSGTTGKMAVLNNRNFIGIEKDETYFNIAKKRIDEAIADKAGRLF